MFNISSALKLFDVYVCDRGEVEGAVVTRFCLSETEINLVIKTKIYNFFPINVLEYFDLSVVVVGGGGVVVVVVVVCLCLCVWPHLQFFSDIRSIFIRFCTH